MKTNWSSKLRSTGSGSRADPRASTRHSLGDALEGVLSGLVALEARVALNPLRTGRAGARPHGAAQIGRLREVLDRDRALVAAGTPMPSASSSRADARASTPHVAPLAIVPEPVAAPPTRAPAGAFATPESSTPASTARVVVDGGESAPKQDQEAAPASAGAGAGAGEEPIRTRTMARLLAAQGHRARALAIYDALTAADPDPSLLAEAERLRSRES
jgi:hypothetical protein